MELATGGNLDQFIKKRNGQNIIENHILYIFKQLLHAVDHLHKNGVIHRDIKPENIFFIRQGLQIKLGDLGVARQKKSSVVSNS